MQITKSQLRKLIKEELKAIVNEGVLDTADILGQYEKWIRSTMRSRGVSAEEAIMDFVILAIAGGDYHLDPTDEHDFDENAFRALLSPNPAMVAALSGDDDDSAGDDEDEDEDYRMVDPAELSRRDATDRKDNTIYRIMDLDPNQNEEALDDMSIDDLEDLENTLERRRERTER